MRGKKHCCSDSFKYMFALVYIDLICHLTFHFSKFPFYNSILMMTIIRKRDTLSKLDGNNSDLKKYSYPFNNFYKTAIKHQLARFLV